MMIIAVGSTAQVRGVLPGLTEMLGEPLATVERYQVCTKRDGNQGLPIGVAAVDADGSVSAPKLMIFSSGGHPPRRSTGPPGPGPAAAGVRDGKRCDGAAGGIWGFHGDHKPTGTS